MRCLLFSVMLLCGCASHYKTLEPLSVEQTCLEAIRPIPLVSAWYTASIDVVGKHMSGLLLIKNMPDSSRRVLFTSETGFTFLDFAFSGDGRFDVITIIKPLNRKSVIETLKKDFLLIIRDGLKGPANGVFQNVEGEVLFAFPKNGETMYLITDKSCSSLERLEVGSRKRKSSVKFHGLSTQAPDSIVLQHHTFNMKITLRKLRAVNVVE